MRRGALTAAVTLPLLLAACGREAPAPPASAAEEALLIGEHEDNVAAFVNGAVVVHRTGEMNLDASAIRAIDSDPDSVWATPPGDLDESMTLALRAPATIRRIGYSTGIVQSAAVASGVRFEASLDGDTFRELGSVTIDGTGEAWLDVPSVRASHLRVTTLPPAPEGARMALVPSIAALGDADAPVAPSPTLDGAWSVNEMTLAFQTTGTVILGSSDEAVARGIDGGWERGLARFAFSRANEVGVGILAVAPAGDHLNGMIWYRRPGAPHFGTSWFGTRAESSPPAAELPDVLDAWLRNEGRFPVYGLSFDGETLDAGSARVVKRLAVLMDTNPPGTFRFRAHEVGRGTEEEDRRRAQAKLDALQQALRDAGADPSRAEFVAGGRVEAVREPDTPWTAVLERLNNRIDLELARVVPR